jgi:hypothetical protein
MCDYGWDGYNVGIQLRQEREERMRRRIVAEKAQDPTKRKSQDPDNQNKDTEERVDKQDVTKETTGEAGAGDFITGTATPDKEG